MGFLGNLLSGGKGTAGANNALLAESVVEHMTASEKKRLAEKVIEMGIQVSRHKETADSFIKFFNNHERLYQLNCVALALVQLSVRPNLPRESWLDVSHPFAVPTDAGDLQAKGRQFSSKHGIPISIRAEPIDLRTWIS